MLVKKEKEKKTKLEFAFLTAESESSPHFLLSQYSRFSEAKRLKSAV